MQIKVQLWNVAISLYIIAHTGTSLDQKSCFRGLIPSASYIIFKILYSNKHDL